jgi:succinylglutamate desuccinylase
MKPSNIFHFVGKKKGPSVALMGGVHGDEKMGICIIDILKKELPHQEIHGEIFLIVGNPEACEKGVRFLDDDMNRLFQEEILHYIQNLPPHQRNREQKRILEILPILQKTDILLDIHSTISPSVPFVFVENTKRHISLAHILGVQYIVSNGEHAPKDMKSCADNFVDRCGGVGITYESGWQKDTANVAEVLKNTKRFFCSVGSAFHGESLSFTPQKKTKHIFLHTSLIPKEHSFRFQRIFRNFDFLPKGSIFATCGGEDILAEKDSYLLFIKTDIKQGVPVCYLASSL